MVSPLPSELLLRILELLLDHKPRNPTPLLLVNSWFHNLCLPILHAVLRFSSIRQLDCFVKTCNTLALRPRTLFISLAGGTADFRLFKLLRELLTHIADIAPKSISESEYARDRLFSQHKLGLKGIQLCLNSHLYDHNCEYLSTALDLTDPEEFIWTGPDPAHHFSIAIVPMAATYLFKAMQAWTSLRHLKLTNLSFPVPIEGGSVHLLANALGVAGTSIADGPPHEHASSKDRAVTRTPMSHLQSIYLGQITFLDPSEIARIACSTALASLTSIRVIDAYQGSIWGPRVRNADVEKAVATLFPFPEQDVAFGYAFHRCNIERIHKVVSCTALTERIMGGDRMDYDA